MSGNETDVFPQRWVRVKGEVLGESVWNKRGECCCPEDLPVPAAIVGRLIAWGASWDAWESRRFGRAHDGIPYPKDEEARDIDAISAEGFAIALAIKRALPDWTVVYFDDNRSAWWRKRAADEPEPPRESYEYEITPEMALEDGA